MKTVVELRKEIRAARRAVDAETRSADSQRICQQVLQLDGFQEADRVAAYLAFDGEVDPMPLMVAAFEQGKQVFLPIIVGKAQPLLFAPWTPSTKLAANGFGILEPQVPAAQQIAGAELDMVVCPLVGFDQQRNRIGVGGGFYDRTFAFLNDPQKEKVVQLIGVAFELQKVAQVKPESWDVRLDAVVTEATVY